MVWKKKVIGPGLKSLKTQGSTLMARRIPTTLDDNKMDWRETVMASILVSDFPEKRKMMKNSYKLGDYIYCVGNEM